MRYSWFFLVMAAACLAGVLRPAFAPHDREPPFAERAETGEIAARIDAVLGPGLLWRGVPGASAAILRDGEIVATWTGGTASALSARPVTAETRFEAASLSKPLTAYAVLRLVDEGLLDLDAPITRGGRTFTLRQALSHSAGFDNRLGDDPAPVGEPGAFAYAGAGYLFLGEEIARVTGRSFEEHMNIVVLPELGMAHSSFGRTEADDGGLALPSLDALLPAGAAFLAAALIALPLLGVHALMARLFGLRGAARLWPPRLIAALALGVGALGPSALLGSTNQVAYLAGFAVLLAIAGGAAVLAHRSGRPSRIAAVGLAALAALFIVLRPAIPLAERAPDFLPAAGLRTTASDYALFLAELMDPQHLDPALAAEMISAQVTVDADTDWGLGIGVTRDESPAIWHWGINFPGYQALAVAWPERGDAVVVLMNGGSMSLAPGGMRFAGLELAREAVIAVEGGPHGGYWRGVQ